ncbi:MAG: hypothetical protein ACFFCM_02625 [Promethearchaeota archaeon]
MKNKIIIVCTIIGLVFILIGIYFFLISNGDSRYEAYWWGLALIGIGIFIIWGPIVAKINEKYPSPKNGWFPSSSSFEVY